MDLKDDTALITSSSGGTGEEFARQLNCGTLELTALFMPAAVKAGHGLVINVASTAAFQPTPGMAVTEPPRRSCCRSPRCCGRRRRGPVRRRPSSSRAPGKEFLTGGRQTPKHVVDTALRAVNGSTPTVVSGLENVVLASAYRHTPRRVRLAVSQQIMKSD